jgi:hypothetical protein
MQVLVKREEGCQSPRIGSAGFVVNPFPARQTASLSPTGPDRAVEKAEAAGPLADLFPPGQFAEFIPMGMTTSFGDGSRATLKMLRRFANIPHILCFGRLRCSEAPGGRQIIEFVPIGVATSFGQGGRATLEMLSRLAHIPHVLCLGQLRLEAKPRR